MTCTGKTMAENLASCPDLSEGQEVIMPIEEPIKKTGHLQTLYGNIAPEGSVAKITGKEGLYFKGFAKCYDSEELMLAALSEDPESFKGSVIVIKYEGPKGGPGMPRCSPRPRPSWARVSVTTAPSSPTDASPVAPTAS